MGRAIGRSVFNVVGRYIRSRLLIFARHDFRSLALVRISGRNAGAVKSAGNVDRACGQSDYEREGIGGGLRENVFE